MPPLYGPDYYASRHAWIMVGTILALATVNHGYKLIAHRFQRVKLSSSYKTIENKESTPITSRKRETSRLPWAVSAAVGNLLYLRTFPLWIYSSTTLGEALLTITYIAVMLALSFYNTWSKGKLDFADQCGVMVFSQVILIVGLAGKNNTISYLTGISYQKLNWMHRASSRTALLLAYIHAMQRIQSGLTRDKVITDSYVQWGVVALICFSGLFLTSFRFVRHLFYEFFLLFHLVFSLMFIIAAYMHYPVPVGYWIWPGFLIWGLDRIVRFGRYFINHRMWRVLSGTKFSDTGKCTVELLEGDVIRVTVKNLTLKWSAGQHAYLSIPSLSKVPKLPHPFSYANLPTSDIESRDAVFLIRAYSGFTRRLANKFVDETVMDIPAFLEGPYGIPHSLTHNSTVLLIAGGTGITFIFSHFLQVLALIPESATEGSTKSAVRNLHLVWNVRHASHVSWIAPILNQAVSSLTIPEGFKVKIEIHVTRSIVASEPENSGEGAHGGISGVIAEEVGHILEKTITHPKEEKDEKAGSSTPESSGSSQMNFSSDERTSGERSRRIEEKEVAFAHDLSFGLSPAAKNLITFSAGRSDIESIIENDIQNSLGPMNVTVCGPTELALATRRAVGAISTGDRVLRGQHEIEFYNETFGF